VDEARFNEVVDEYAADARSVGLAEPTEALARAVQLCEKAPDDDHLLVLSVVVLDPLLDENWDEIGLAFEVEMKRSAPLRKAWSGTMTDIPRAAIDRLDGLLQPGEDIGRMGA
jgi:hypothetical protein